MILQATSNSSIYPPKLKGANYIIFNSAKLLNLLNLPVHIKPILCEADHCKSLHDYPYLLSVADFNRDPCTCNYALRNFDEFRCQKECDHNDCCNEEGLLRLFGKSACQFTYKGIS